MNKKITLVIITFFCAISGVFAQKKKPATPTKSTTKTASIPVAEKEKANKMISYTNSLQDFLSQYIPTTTISLPLSTYQEAIETESTYFNTETLDESFKTVGQAITDYKNDKGSNPTEPPAIIGSENQAFIKAKIAECSNLYEKIKTLNNSLKPLTPDNNLEKSNFSKVKNIVKEMYATLDKIYEVQDNLYDRIDEIGLQAESITLSNHPMKTEILDMKIVMNKSKKVFSLLAQNTPNQAKENIQEIKNLETQALLIGDKYADKYTAEGSGKNNSIELRSAVKRFFEQVANYYWHVDEIVTEIKNEKIDPEEWNTKVKMQKDNYELLVGEYNTFVSVNNGE